ncbi:MAG: response regulator [Spartobacteria bacterium]|nr:response regulator [Spartobacteria bacterium]
MNPASLRILLAEDEPHTRLSLSIILRKAGHEVTAVGNGQEVLHCLDDKVTSGDPPFDVLVMDFQMPVMNGHDVLVCLRNSPLAPPVIIVTGYGDRKLVNQLHQHGCVRVIHKPFEPQELVEAVNGVGVEERCVEAG